MAVKSKSTRGATKKRTASGPKKTVKIAGSGTFTHQACFTSKIEAAKKADRIRAKGNKARVIESGSAHCVYKGGKMKANAPFLKTRKKRRA